MFGGALRPLVYCFLLENLLGECLERLAWTIFHKKCLKKPSALKLFEAPT